MKDNEIEEELENTINLPHDEEDDEPKAIGQRRQHMEEEDLEDELLQRESRIEEER